MINKTQVDINDRIDQSNGVNKYVFFATKPYTGDTREYGDIFDETGMLHSLNKRLVYFLEGQKMVLSKIPFRELV